MLIAVDDLITITVGTFQKGSEGNVCIQAGGTGLRDEGFMTGDSLGL